MEGMLIRFMKGFVYHLSIFGYPLPPTIAYFPCILMDYMQIAAFISTLMMVGVVTMPVEIRYFGKKATLVRNAAAFGFSLIVAFAMGVVL